MMLSSSSSSSSGEIGSLHGTPETKSTLFSPENFREQPKIPVKKSTKVSIPPTFNIHSTTVNENPTRVVVLASISKEQDPFTGNCDTYPGHLTSFAGLKLSPIAASFTPLTLQERLTSTTNPDSSSQPHVDSQHSNETFSTTEGPICSELGDVFRNHPPKTQVHGVGLSQSSSLPSSKANESVDRLMEKPVPSASGGPTRYLMISRVPRMTNAQELNFVFIVSLNSPRTRHKQLTGQG